MEHQHNKPQVLFLSTGNAARSQMAEGFLRALGSHHFDAMSAGVKPGPLNPLATEVMKEKGIDISKYESKNVAQCIKHSFSYDLCGVREELFDLEFDFVAGVAEDFYFLVGGSVGGSWILGQPTPGLGPSVPTINGTG